MLAVLESFSLQPLAAAFALVGYRSRLSDPFFSISLFLAGCFPRATFLPVQQLYAGTEPRVLPGVDGHRVYRHPDPPALHHGSLVRWRWMSRPQRVACCS